MRHRRVILLCCLLGLGAAEAAGQFTTFGYFQTSFQHWTSFSDESAKNTFSLQQLNLFFQTDVSRRWRAFVNFEVLNNFSSSRRWGGFNIEEAWLRYRVKASFNLKIGLQIPIFNNLNEIKNRTPLLPYIIRPLVYETSFSEIIPTEDFVPARAFVQAYGFVPVGRAKIDYAAYLGNSPNIRSQFDNVREGEDGQTGIDTTITLLAGGRLGLRLGEVRAGVSATHDVTNELQGVEAFFGGSASRFTGISRVRLGADFSYHLGRLLFEGEWIRVSYDDDEPDLNVDKAFFYGTLGFQLTEQVFVYATYWDTLRRQVEFNIHGPDGLIPVFPSEFDIEVIQAGVAYTPNDRITFKAQAGPVDLVQTVTVVPFGDIDRITAEFNLFSIAASVLFN
ncbi:MAG: hypothetical protein IH820_02085 [Bacteroidetes bacterium]|nr:hypothetical protein [Bacteroidota bacterium]